MSGAVEQALPGLRDTPLGSYLGAIGLAKVVAEQADPTATLRWAGSVPHLRTTVADLPEWLQSTYRPTVVLSPWNGGSGYKPNDKNQRKALAELLALDESRVSTWRLAHAVIAPLAARAEAEGWDKQRLVRELRNRVPEQLLAWIDAAVVLTRDDLAFPPLLGTGGNDGRFDFSSNFHQRLLDVLPPKRRAESLGWAHALLDGSSAKLVAGAVGQFDPASAGGRNSSAFGAADSLANPWGFVLMVEGASALTPGVVQRLHGGNRAAMPFTVQSSPYGGGAGAAPEQSRGEFWAPRWLAPMSWPEIAQLFREGRSTWDGRTAARAVHMYEAARSFGVARGIDAFTRYGLQQRNGLAFVAVQLDRVDVHEDALVHALLPIEHWIQTARAAESQSSTEQQWRRADRAHLLYAQSGGSSRLVDLLAESTRLTLAVGASRHLKEKVSPFKQSPTAKSLQLALAEDLAARPEARLARVLMTAKLQPDGVRTGLAQLLVPHIVVQGGRNAWVDVAVPGFGQRAISDVLADVAVLCTRRRTAERGPDSKTVTGLRLTSGKVLAPWQDLHSWVSGYLDLRLLERYLLAFLALDWSKASEPGWGPMSHAAILDPALALLSPFAQGLRAEHDSEHVPTFGIDPTWPGRLRAGQEGDVMREAVRRLARPGWRASEPILRKSRGRPARLAAALLIPTHSMTALRMVATPPKPTNDLFNGTKESIDEPEDVA